VLKVRCGEILGATVAWSLHVREQDPNVVQFRYPSAITKNVDYVSPQVVLELGTHAEFVPHDRFMIRSFAAETFPNVVVDGDVAVVALLAKRTFWEKATILHAEYYRPPEKPILDRYSRHYYDVAMLAQGPIRADALVDKELLTQVVRHQGDVLSFRPGSLRSCASGKLPAFAGRESGCGVGTGLPEYGCHVIRGCSQIRLDHGNADGA
jgi:hypothetical protein